MNRSSAIAFVLLVTVALGCGSAKSTSPSPQTITIPSESARDRSSESNGHPLAARDSSEEKALVPISSDDPTWGSRTALVTIVEFSDFQCPFCTRVGPTLSQIRKQYGPEQVRFVWKHRPLPFHNHARSAAAAAAGVFALGGNDAFWKFHDIVFQNQSSLDPAKYAEWAHASGVDSLPFQQESAPEDWVKKVERDDALADALDIHGTPSFLINGILLGGAQPFSKFENVIEQEISNAKALLASGTPKEKLYEASVAANYKKEQPAEEEKPVKKDSTTIWKATVGSSPQLGNRNALVTIIEFSDFQCPFCKRAEETLAQIRTLYADKVRIVWKNQPLPFHPRARPAAEFALEARAQKGDKGFWEAHRKLFESQPSLEDSDLDSIAKAMNLNLHKVHASLKGNKHKNSIGEDGLLAEDLQVRGTPYFFINGRTLVGAQPIEAFKQIIDEEIVRANAILAQGIAPSALYDALIKDGKRDAKTSASTKSPRSDKR